MLKRKHLCLLWKKKVQEKSSLKNLTRVNLHLIVIQRNLYLDISNKYINFSQQGSELTYAELTLRGNRRIPPNCYQSVQISGIQRPQLLPMSTLTRRQPIQEPTIYAQVASHSKPIYVPPPHPYMNRPSDETTAETPLIGHDNKVTGIRSILLKC